MTVTWSYTGTVGNVNIDLSTNGGTNWSGLVSNTACDGTESVTVSSNASTTCLVRVQGMGGTPADSSNANFTIANASSELLTNPGFETGSASGWTNGAGTVTIGQRPSGGNDNPHTGSYQAYWNSPNTSNYLYQNVSLSGYASSIDAGNARITATAG